MERSPASAATAGDSISSRTEPVNRDIPPEQLQRIKQNLLECKTSNHAARRGSRGEEPGNTIIRGLITQPGGWRLEGYKNIEQFLPMRLARDLEDETHTATFFAVNGCTMNGTCARAECQTKGRLIPLYDKSQKNEEASILFFRWSQARSKYGFKNWPTGKQQAWI
ncbi:hypothetical protein GUITHDRAFT_156590 [Guillardia theta CCMP2712]|uniref:Uncharacterized protein n=1 Tax=Guillardia theta (strain CCMP2712) TaxID=905079 RepID=L1I6A9_GUITC|nr:hypothetical protein GUITHDRAFT_156590 [Guillardia theta CCMP2712]EKX31419.1 hypothetical protein GUITHDRAFT_156590 [Guillardia theta CCMP2712]|mmetsp:Transcript_20061/g.66746  ORF Transcript_20061/g.66746 Transcript_20061/m.66746 type:complete len:166 (-) Transcript_20061:786-1283(-)|eukprot:XP_005818399.1 hypothetical protein GUITHDRAFT_156590 [Guillardia theta CCMP2712]